MRIDQPRPTVYHEISQVKRKIGANIQTEQDNVLTISILGNPHICVEMWIKNFHS